MFKEGEWVSGWRCHSCTRLSPIFSAEPKSGGDSRTPVRGVLEFSCRYCGTQNLANGDELIRYRLGKESTPKRRKSDPSEPKMEGR